jgi:hypothetical protein
MMSQFLDVTDLLGSRHGWPEIWSFDGEIACLDPAIQLELLYGDLRELNLPSKFGNALRKLHPVYDLPSPQSSLT